MVKIFLVRNDPRNFTLHKAWNKNGMMVTHVGVMVCLSEVSKCTQQDRKTLKQLLGTRGRSPDSGCKYSKNKAVY